MSDESWNRLLTRRMPRTGPDSTSSTLVVSNDPISSRYSNRRWPHVSDVSSITTARERAGSARSTTSRPSSRRTRASIRPESGSSSRRTRAFSSDDAVVRKLEPAGRGLSAVIRYVRYPRAGTAASNANRLRHAETVAYDWIGWNGRLVPDSSRSPSVGFSPPYSSSTIERTGQACGLKTTIGTYDGSVGRSIRRESVWMERFWLLPAIEL